MFDVRWFGVDGAINVQPRPPLSTAGTLELQFVELEISAMPFDQLSMGAPFDDSSLVQNDDDVRLLDRGEPVGDTDRRPSLHEFFQRGLNSALRFRIQRTGCFVENEDRSIL